MEDCQHLETTATNISRPVSARDFARGFGLNVQDEEIFSSFGFKEVVPPIVNHATAIENKNLSMSHSDIDIIAPKPLHSRHNSKFSQSMEQISSLAQPNISPIKGRHSFDYGKKLLNISRRASEGDEDSIHSQSSMEEADDVGVSDSGN